MPGSLFVTGATGFVGSRLIEKLAPSRRVICLSRGKPLNAPRNVEFIQGDLASPASYAEALRQCAGVIHLAAVTGKAPRKTYFQVNREGTRALVGECRQAGVRHFLYVSTIAAKFVNQNRYWYAQSKRQAEEAVITSGLPYTIVRPTMVMGKGSPVFEGLSRLANLPLIPVFGNGLARVQPVSVADLLALLAAIPDEPAFVGRTVEAGGPEILTIENLLLRIRGLHSRGRARIVHLPAGAIAGCVGLLENLLLPVLPFTAGQIASFTNEGTAEPDPLLAKWRAGMQTVDQMLPLGRS